MGVSIRFKPSIFQAGGRLENTPTRKARYIMNSGVFSAPHIAHGAWFGPRDPGDPQPPNSVTVTVHGTSTSWFETVDEFNRLPYDEIRGQIANEVERGILEVLNSVGAVATVAQIRAGTVT